MIQNNGQYISRFNECSLPLKIVDSNGVDIFVNDGFIEDNYVNKTNDDLVYIEKDENPKKEESVDIHEVVEAAHGSLDK